MTDGEFLLRQIDLREDIDRALAERKEKRAARSDASKRGWASRRAGR